MISAHMQVGDTRIPFVFNTDDRQAELLTEMDHMSFVCGLQTIWISDNYFEKLVEELYHPFDYALPQSFFDDYLKQYGHAPRGIWGYSVKRGQPIWGRFVSRIEIMEEIGQVVTGLFKAGKFEMEK